MSRPRSHLLFLLVLVALGLLLRLDYLLVSDFRIDSDEAIVGLMADDILDSGRLPVFYYGQHYMGSLEPVTAALIFHALGESSSFALKLAPLFYSILFLLVLYQLALESFSARAGIVALALAALSPPVLLVWSSKARGGFIEIVLIGTLCLLYAQRWLRAENPSLVQSMLVGFFGGLGWWVNNQILYFLLPLGLLLLLRSFSREEDFVTRLRFFLLHSLAALVSFLVGGLPFWLHNLALGFPSFGLFGFASPEAFLEQFFAFFEISLPILLGAARYWGASELFSGARLIALILFGAACFYYLLAYRNAILQLLRGRVGQNAFPAFIPVLFVSTVLIFSASKFGYLSEAPRYLLPLYVPIFLFFAVTVDKLSSRQPILGAAFLLFVLGFQVLASYGFGRSIPGEPFVFSGERVSKDHSELEAWLDSRGIDFVQTNYWIGYRLAFETSERVRFAIFAEPDQARIPEYELEFRARDKASVPYLLVPKQAELVRSALRLEGKSFQEETLSGYSLIYNVQDAQPKALAIPSSELSLSSSHGSELLTGLMDDNLKTRWGSASPQEKGMSLRLSAENLAVSGIRLRTAGWEHDHGRRLAIDLVGPAGKERILSPKQYMALRYAADEVSDLTLRFETRRGLEAVEITQLGEHPLFDWSIAELDLLLVPER